MTMKKSLIAMAVAGATTVPMAAQAEPELYGIVDIGLESFSADGNQFGQFDIFQGFNQAGNSFDNADDKDFTLSNGLQSRLGVRGSEDLGNGLTASYRMEFSVDVLDEGGGSANSGTGLGTRLGWVALGGDWGTVKIGSQWQDTFAYSAWNVHRTDVHGYGTYFYTTGLMPGSLAYGFRQDSTIGYTYGSGGYGSDPFTFSVQANIGEDFGVGVNEDGLSALSAYAAGTFGSFTINGGIVQSFIQPIAGGNAAEPSMVNIGGRWSVNDMIELGINYTEVDRDVRNNENRDAFNVAGFFNWGNGWDAHVGLGFGEDDRNENTFAGRDIDLDLYGFVRKALSSRTDVRLEFENIEYDGSAGTTSNDPSNTVLMLALQHNF